MAWLDMTIHDAPLVAHAHIDAKPRTGLARGTAQKFHRCGGWGGWG